MPTLCNSSLGQLDADLSIHIPIPQLRKQRDQEVSPEAEAEVAVRAVLATKLPTLTFDDNARCAGAVCGLAADVPYVILSTPIATVRGRPRATAVPHIPFLPGSARCCQICSLVSQ